MKRNTSHSIRKSSLYDYSGSIERQETIAFLLDFASKSKTGIEEYWKKMKRYYDGDHDIRGTYSRFAAEQSLPWLPAQSTDGYVHVESQINATVPDFEFSPREKNDTDKAKQREKIVKYICDNANLAYKNARNERLLGIYGSSVWKVCWDSAAAYGENNGDVAVLCPSPDEIYTDPTSTDVDGCEYIGYVYRMHKQKAMRIFAEDFKSTNSCFEDYLDDNGFFSSHSNVTSDTYDAENDTVSITEWWFRQPSDGKAKVKIGEEYALDVLYSTVPEDLLKTEIDTCWVNVAGVNPAEYVIKYTGRAPVVHLKDFRKSGAGQGKLYDLIGIDDEEGAEEEESSFSFMPVGHGMQDIPAILAACEDAGAEWVVVEQDNPEEGETRINSVRLSREYLKTLSW